MQRVVVISGAALAAAIVAACGVVGTRAASHDATVSGPTPARSQREGNKGGAAPGNKVGRTTGKLNITDPEAMAREVARVAPLGKVMADADNALHSGDLAVAENKAKAALDMIRQFNEAGQPTDGAKGARRILAEVRIRQDRYAEALDLLLPDQMRNESMAVDDNVALCLVKVGRGAEAARGFNASAWLRFNHAIHESDLPPVVDDASLEARIRVARAADFSGRGLQKEALAEDLIADRLAPGNAAIAFFVESSLAEEGRFDEAKPYRARAVMSPNPKIAEQADALLRVGN